MLAAMTEPVRPSSRAPWLLARLAQAAIVVAAVVEVYRAATQRARLLHPGSTSASGFGFASMVSVYAMTLAAVLFLVWFSRSRRAARAISPEAPLATGTWAVVAWLIPLVNLWVPRRLLLETQRASRPGATQEQGRDDLLVNAWAVALASRVVVALVGRSGTSLPLLVASQALNIAAAILIICVIQRLTAVQSAAPDAMRPALQGA
jgi:hypothetical protein